MVTDLVISWATSILSTVVGWLPDGAPLSLPDVSGMLQLLADVDSVLPIKGAITVAVLLLGFLVVFLSVRLVLMLWQQLPFT